MAFVTGTAANHKILSDFLRDFCTNRTVATVAVNSGGSGYVVGDVVTINSGAPLNSMTATIEVTAVSAGVVTSIRLLSSGSFASGSEPDVIGSATTGGTGTGLTLNTTSADVGWTLHRDIRGWGVEGIDAITAAGSGYTALDIVTLDTSSEADVTLNAAVGEATFQITSVGGSGEVTGIIALTPGAYSLVQNEPVTGIPVTGGSGLGLTLDPAFYTVGNVSGTNPDAIFEEREVVIEGIGAGSDSIFIGWSTYQTESGANRNWEIHGFTGFNATLDALDQPGVSPGDALDQGSFNGGAFVPMQNASLEFWFFVNSSRAVVVARAGTVYVNMYMGFIERFATSGEFPYPLCISGCSSDPGTNVNDGVIFISGLCDPIGNIGNVDVGPMFLRYPDGTWRAFANSGGSVRVQLRDRVVTPCGRISNPSGADDWYSTFESWQLIIPQAGTPGDPQRVLSVAVDGGDGLPVLYPCTLVADSPGPQMWGELSGVYWVSKSGTTPALQPEDEIVVNNEIYLVFQNGNRADNWASFAVKQE